MEVKDNAWSPYFEPRLTRKVASPDVPKAGGCVGARAVLADVLLAQGRVAPCKVCVLSVYR